MHLSVFRKIYFRRAMERTNDQKYCATETEAGQMGDKNMKEDLLNTFEIFVL